MLASRSRLPYFFHAHIHKSYLECSNISVKWNKHEYSRMNHSPKRPNSNSFMQSLTRSFSFRESLDTVEVVVGGWIKFMVPTPNDITTCLCDCVNVPCLKSDSQVDKLLLLVSWKINVTF